MTAPLDIDFVDTRADQLVYSLDEPVIPPVLARNWTFVDPAGQRIDVELAVLGCSHQVTVHAGGNHTDGNTVVRETLACLPGRQPWLPAENTHPIAPGRHLSFASAVEEPANFVHAVNRIEQAVARSEAQCSVEFPGLPGAVTALCCDRQQGGLVWRTWHCYPQSGHIVRTRSVLTLGHPQVHKEGSGVTP